MHDDIAQKEKSLGILLHLQTGKHSFIYLSETFPGNNKYVLIRWKCSLKTSYFKKIQVNKKNITTLALQ